MEPVLKAIQFVVDLGPAVMLPIVMTVLALCFRVRFGRALRSGLMIGVGFVGIGLVVSLLTNNLGPAAHVMSQRFGISLSVVDIGWPGASPLTWASRVAVLAIPVAILVNILMLLTRLTRVVNVDIWNIWHFAFSGALVNLATGSFAWALAAVAVHAAVAYKFGDWFAPVLEEYYELDGIAVPHGTSAYMGPVAVPVDWALDRIPVVRSINVNAGFIEKKFGALGEPMVIGGVLGCVIGALAGYDVKGILSLGIQMAAVMVLMPKVVKCIMEGLIPISEAARSSLQKRFSGARFYIGLDPAILLGDSQVISASLLFVPLTIAIAILMPGNEVLPFGDLATIGFFIAMAVGIHKGNLFRTLISGTIIMIITVWIANQTIALNTMLAKSVGSSLIANESTRIASLDQGGSPITYLMTQGLGGITNLNGFVVIGVLYVFCIVFTALIYRSRMARKRAAAAG
ncbi:MAG: galactitol-specific PTS transporter subunit IIC [Deltaproteobacteria bacterium]|jgi:PTS system galactitol-specific IIC component|nr:galactitol-specific PTS transporter subunit IIC [Deltaproteobacteria bacterium]